MILLDVQKLMEYSKELEAKMKEIKMEAQKLLAKSNEIRLENLRKLGLL